jgi:CDP-diacylglycerol--glycerol-3-phosphate 3-phosphatidyltransferase
VDGNGMLENLKPWYNATLRPFARLCGRLGIHPNMVTLAGVGLFAISGWYLAWGHWRRAVVIGIIGACMDGLDGVIAREQNKKTIFGAILDSTCDRITEILLLGGISVWYLTSEGASHVGVMLAFAAVTGSLMVSYVKARAEGAGVPCKEGFFQRPERLVFLCVFILLGSKILVWGLGLLAVFSYVTAIQRIFIVWGEIQRNHKDN